MPNSHAHSRAVSPRRLAWLVLAPSLVAYAFVNWDALPVLLATAAIFAHRRGDDAMAGAFVGFGAAAKLYPGLLLPLFALARWRQGRTREAVRAYLLHLTTAPDAGELAFEVVDAHQGRGIASALVDAVTTVARARGITWMEATVEPGNLASEAVLAQIGIELFLSDGLLEGRGELRPAPSTTLVNQRAVLALAGQEASSSSTAAATWSS